jgi:two-component system, chemotaxis family, response regulator PixH
MSKKILVIDDNDVDLLLSRKYLERSGYDQIITASDAAEGIKKAIEEKPDLVISDTVLPDNNGFEICRQIREACGTEKPKIIITTGSLDAVDATQARRAGADDYCGKSSDCAALLEIVRRLI